MDAHTEGLHSLLLLEDTLDREVERLEEELIWNRRKLVYLQALGCLDSKLSDLTMTIKKSEGVIDTMKQLLQRTFEERLVCVDEVEHLRLSSAGTATSLSTSRTSFSTDGSQESSPNFLHRRRPYAHLRRCHRLNVIQVSKGRRSQVKNENKDTSRRLGNKEIPDALSKEVFTSGKGTRLHEAGANLGKITRSSSSRSHSQTDTEILDIGTRMDISNGCQKAKIAPCAARFTSTKTISQNKLSDEQSNKSRAFRSVPSSSIQQRLEKSILRRFLKPKKIRVKKYSHSLSKHHRPLAERPDLRAGDELFQNPCHDRGDVSECPIPPPRDNEVNKDGGDSNSPGHAHGSVVGCCGVQNRCSGLADTRRCLGEDVDFCSFQCGCCWAKLLNESNLRE